MSITRDTQLSSVAIEPSVQLPWVVSSGLRSSLNRNTLLFTQIAKQLPPSDYFLRVEFRGSPEKFGRPSKLPDFLYSRHPPMKSNRLNDILTGAGYRMEWRGIVNHLRRALAATTDEVLILRIALQALEVQIPEEYLEQRNFAEVPILDGARKFIQALYPKHDGHFNHAERKRSKNSAEARLRLRDHVRVQPVLREDLQEEARKVPACAWLILEAIRMIKALELAMDDEIMNNWPPWIEHLKLLEVQAVADAGKYSNRNTSRSRHKATAALFWPEASLVPAARVPPQPEETNATSKGGDADSEDRSDLFIIDTNPTPVKQLQSIAHEEEPSLLAQLEDHIDRQVSSVGKTSSEPHSLRRRAPTLFSFPIKFSDGRGSRVISFTSGYEPLMAANDFVSSLELPSRCVAQIFDHIQKHKEGLKTTAIFKEDGVDTGEVMGPELALRIFDEPQAQAQVKEEGSPVRPEVQVVIPRRISPFRLGTVSPPPFLPPKPPLIAVKRAAVLGTGETAPPPVQFYRSQGLPVEVDPEIKQELESSGSPPQYRPRHTSVFRNSAVVTPSHPTISLSRQAGPVTTARVVQNMSSTAVSRAAAFQHTDLPETAPQPSKGPNTGAMRIISNFANASEFVSMQTKESIAMRAMLRVFGMDEARIQYCIEHISRGESPARVLRRLGYDVTR